MAGVGNVGMPGTNSSAPFSTGSASSGETVKQPSPSSMPQTFAPEFTFQGDGFGTDPMSLPHVSVAVPIRKYQVSFQTSQERIT